MQSKLITQCAKFRTAFVSPDRSQEQRDTHRRLMMERKEKALADPAMRFYIQGGQIFFPTTFAEGQKISRE